MQKNHSQKLIKLLLYSTVYSPVCFLEILSSCLFGGREGTDMANTLSVSLFLFYLKQNALFECLKPTTTGKPKAWLLSPTNGRVPFKKNREVLKLASLLTLWRYPTTKSWRGSLPSVSYSVLIKAKELCGQDNIFAYKLRMLLFF